MLGGGAWARFGAFGLGFVLHLVVPGWFRIPDISILGVILRVGFLFVLLQTSIKSKPDPNKNNFPGIGSGLRLFSLQTYSKLKHDPNPGQWILGAESSK